MGAVGAWCRMGLLTTNIIINNGLQIWGWPSACRWRTGGRDLFLAIQLLGSRLRNGAGSLPCGKGLRSLEGSKVNTLGQKCQSGPNEWNQLHAYAED